MKTNSKPDRKIVFAWLWIFAMFNYLYADILSLFDVELLKSMLNGTSPVAMNQTTLFAGAVLMETAIAMIIISRFSSYHINRWANIIAGFIHTAAVFASMFAGKPAPYYLLYGIIEMSCTLFIIWYAWTWPKPAQKINIEQS
jgi:hypothetical protein